MISFHALLFLAVAGSCYADKVRFHGKITFKDVAPWKLPAGSHLFVSVYVSEPGRTDVRSHIIGTQEVSLKDYDKESNLEYNVDVDESTLEAIREIWARKFEVVAFLNVGWTPTTPVEFRPKDFGTGTTKFSAGYYRPGRNDYERDISLVMYNCKCEC